MGALAAPVVRLKRSFRHDTCSKFKILLNQSGEYSYGANGGQLIRASAPNANLPGGIPESAACHPHTSVLDSPTLPE